MLRECINQYYDVWVGFAHRYIQRSKLPMDACEVVNDVLCSLLERNTDKLEQMIARKPSELDLFVRHIIKSSIYSPRSPFRYTRHLQRRACSLDEEFKDDRTELEEPAAPEDILRGVNATEIEKKVFVWVIVEGQRIAGWEGEESKRQLYRAYSRVLKKIIHKKG